jgi:hypothetical protein
MGNFDRRNSMKMRRRKAQSAKKARLKRVAAEKGKARTGTIKKTTKKAAKV